MIDPKLIEILRKAQHVVVFTGAGVSAESGVPTFRDAQTGLWAQYSAEELATPEAFLRHPQLVWDWYMWRRELVAQAQPNPAHIAIAQMQRLLPKLTLITQNVDGLHQQAGSTEVLELHGNISRTKCFSCGVYADSWQDERHPPHCVQCDGLLRPDVVWFGESLPADILVAARQAVEQCDVLISVGTSGLVYPAAELPFDAAAHGAIVVQVNPTATPLDGITPFNLQGRAGERLPSLIDLLGD
jgi:NAD-dependent deacetylase